MAVSVEWHDPEQRDGRGERGEDVDRQTGFDIFTTPFEDSGRATRTIAMAVSGKDGL